MFYSNKMFALAGGSSRLSLHQYVKKMSCLSTGLPNTWKTPSEPRKTDHRGSVDLVGSASVNCESYTLVREPGSSV